MLQVLQIVKPGLVMCYTWVLLRTPMPIWNSELFWSTQDQTVLEHVLLNLWHYSATSSHRLQQWWGISTWYISLYKLVLFPCLKNSWRQNTAAWLDNPALWMSCVTHNNQVKGYSGEHKYEYQYQLTVIYCHLEWGVENVQQLIANHNVLRGTATCHQQAGIWTGVKSKS